MIHHWLVQVQVLVLKHPALRLMLSILTLRMSPLVDQVTTSQMRHFANAAIVTYDIIAPMNVDHDYSYVKLPSDSVRTKTLAQMMHTI